MPASRSLEPHLAGSVNNVLGLQTSASSRGQAAPTACLAAKAPVSLAWHPPGLPWPVAGEGRRESRSSSRSGAQAGGRPPCQGGRRQLPAAGCRGPGAGTGPAGPCPARPCRGRAAAGAARGGACGEAAGGGLRAEGGRVRRALPGTEPRCGGGAAAGSPGQETRRRGGRAGLRRAVRGGRGSLPPPLPSGPSASPGPAW